MATDMFMKFSDSIFGEAVGDHAKEVQVISWSWGMTQSGDMHIGTGGGSGKVDVQNLTFTHYIDASTPILIQKCCDGTHIASADLTVRKAGGASPVEYLKVSLSKCIVAAVTSGGADTGDRITENVTLNFRQFKVEYTPQDDKGAKGTTVPVLWNIATNKAKWE